MENNPNYSHASEHTVNELRTIAESLQMSDLSELSLPDIEAVIEQVGKMVPAGDVPSVILSGLTLLKERQASSEDAKRDTNLLFKGIEKMLDGAVYGTFFAGPAAVIWGYQNLLKLAGKNPEDYFPQGYWQFYIEYALREDTARHTNETHGFDTVLRRHQISLSDIDRTTAWIMAAIHCLHQYDALLQNEWRERTYTRILREVTADEPDAASYAKLYREWEKKRPYRRGPDVKAGHTYATYRRIKFDKFIESAIVDLSAVLRHRWVEAVRRVKEAELNAYQEQMSILAYLKPGPYGEDRVPIDITKASIGVVINQHYYLIPLCKPHTRQPADAAIVRSQVAAAFADAAQRQPGEPLTPLARMRRAYLPKLRGLAGSEMQEKLAQLDTIPILLNMDQRPLNMTLSEIRQAERGAGSHAITIFTTGDTFVFDQSHIFFDGSWGAAMAEIITNEAIAWGVYLNTLPPIFYPTEPPNRLGLDFNQNARKILQNSPKATAEVSAESQSVHLRNLLALRRIFKLRSDLIQLTVNDLLVLYRAIHAFNYKPTDSILEAVKALQHNKTTAEAARLTLESIQPHEKFNPAVLIPVDASQRKPSDRVHPMTFQVPIHELHLLDLHQRVISALNHYKLTHGEREGAYAEFDELQRAYLAALAGCGTLFARAKAFASRGASTSVGTIKLMAHLPVPLQRLLDKIPDHFELLNDIIKGREVFSNVGAVAPSSSLVRFMTAKDDNENKSLTWGVLTDAENIMHISLRDFRPHVTALHACGQARLAQRIIQDYLDAYTHGLNEFVRDLRRVTMASRETRMVSDVGMLDARDSR